MGFISVIYHHITIKIFVVPVKFLEKAYHLLAFIPQFLVCLVPLFYILLQRKL